MFITITKNRIILCMCVAILVTCIAVYARSVYTTAAPIDEKLILIDPGHGGEDGGAVGKSGVLEKDLTLTISQKLQKLVDESEFQAIITRSDDRSMHDADKTTIKAKKNSDLANRRRMIRESGAAVFVSIHMNTYPDEKVKGAQVFYSTANEQSKVLAENIRVSLLEVLQDGNKREIKPIPSKVLILKDAPIPAVIVECGFLSNFGEEALLKDEAYQQKIAEAVFNGVVRYLTVPTPNTAMRGNGY